MTDAPRSVEPAPPAAPVGPEASPEGPEVDPRFLLANERTFLAYIRTALALLAAGLAVVQFVEPLRVPHAGPTIGVPLLALAGALSFSSYGRWRRIDRALHAGRDLPQARVPLFVAAGVLVVAVAAVVLAVLAFVDEGA